MNAHRFLPLVAILLLTATAGAYVATSVDVSTPDRTERLDETRTAHLIHDYVNDEREAQGLDPLDYDSQLASIAGNHSRDMASQGRPSHVSATGDTVTDRYAEAGYQCPTVAAGNGTSPPELVGTTQVYTKVDTERGPQFFNSERELARGIVDAWMASPQQRQRLLQPAWRVDGVGVEIRADNTVYVTQDFC